MRSTKINFNDVTHVKVDIILLHKIYVTHGENRKSELVDMSSVNPGCNTVKPHIKNVLLH